MPRNNAVDYPHVPHRPYMQPQSGLAPPTNHQDRYSWQATPVEAVSPNSEEQLEDANNRRRYQVPDNPQSRQPRIPPLPVLPDHLAQDQKPVLPSQRRDMVLAQTQQQEDNTQAVEEQAVEPHVDVSQQFQQPQLQHHIPVQGLAPPYTQTFQQQQYYHQSRSVEPAAGTYNGHQSQHAHTYPPPVANGRLLSPVKEVQSPQEFKTPITEPTQSHPPLQPIHVGPDENPLSCTSPGSVHFPTTVPSTSRPVGVIPEMQFTQSNYFNSAQPIQGGSWHYSLGSCSDPATCFPSLFCPCLIYGRTQHRLSIKSSGKDSTNMLGFSSVNGSCIAWSILPGLNVLLTAIQHRRIRKAYKLDGQAGNFVGDCFKGICCCCCMLAQAEKEMKVREVSTPKKIEGYKAPVDMVFAPQNR